MTLYKKITARNVQQAFKYLDINVLKKLQIFEKKMGVVTAGICANACMMKISE